MYDDAFYVYAVVVDLMITNYDYLKFVVVVVVDFVVVVIAAAAVVVVVMLIIDVY